MAVLAFFAVQTLVLVLEFMTGYTVVLELLFVQVIALVALPTRDALMAAFELKLCIFVMIELELCPTILHVAVFALLAVSTFVLVIVAMTLKAFFGDVFVTFVDMTRGTVDADVLTLEGKVSA